MTTTLLPDRHAPDDRRWDRLALLLLLAVGVARLVYLALWPLDLAADESYYWDWTRQLDWCYYSKPPMIAWLIALSTAVLGDHEFGVRFLAPLFSTGMLAALYALGRAFFSRRVALLAVVLALLSPGQIAAGILFTIDAPFLFFWTAALACIAWALRDAPGRPRLWLAAGILAGLGLLTKQTMIGLPMVVGATLVVVPGWWPLLWRRFPLLVAPMAVATLPVIGWNAQHDWITFQHTSEHFGESTWTLVRGLTLFFESLAAQAALVNPVVFAAFIAAFAVGLRRALRGPTYVRFLLMAGPLPLLAVWALGLTQRVQPNWPAPFYVAAILLATAWIAGEWRKRRDETITADDPETDAAPELRRRWWRTAWPAGAILALTLLALPWVTLAVSGPSGGPLKRVHGWSAMATAVATERANHPRTLELPVIAATPRQHVSALAFYLPAQPRVWHWTDRRRLNNQYLLWGGPVDRLGEDFLVAVAWQPETGFKPTPPLEGRFARLEPLGLAAVPGNDEGGIDRERSLMLYRGVTLQDWPPATP